ncbi:hypothetical protein [[Limnothrix rosea] IAM M-220]|uniref:hypothetical protein n=1 Tax=[Limnothrix rosea] IAM M-220 TaxID=454133 RepID=UPI0009667F4D|nr:hypothetical protein [[Limnothrix rosea] IAM M-220]OKH18486.1 hypothetical protein NIES208_05880 [[Limnothrix rosea] IAM M-220]
MESSGSSGKPADPSSRWSDLLGTAIALLTLTIPLLIIGYYSHRPAAPDLVPELSSRLIE